MVSKKSSLAAQADRNSQRERALGSVFAKTNRILTGNRKITVSVRDGKKSGPFEKYPGYTIYPNIYIHSNFFRDLFSPETMIELLGLNYHELSHVMFTDRTFGERHVAPRPALKMAWNLLEDERIESFFTAMYEPAGKYFTQTFIKLVLREEKNWVSAFMWSYGRSYLPLEIREALEERFMLPRMIPQIKILIDRYKGYTSKDFTNKPYEVLETIEQFQDILNRLNKYHTPEEQCVGSDQTATKNDEGVDKEQEEQAAEIDKERREKEEETGEDQSGFWEDDDTDSDGEGEEDGQDSGDEDASGDGDREDSEADEDSNSSAGNSESDDEELQDSDGQSGHEGDDDENVDRDGEDVDGGQEAGNSDLIFDDEEFEDFLEEIQEAISEDTEVINELERVTAAVNDTGNIDLIDFDDTQGSTRPIESDLALELNEVTQHFRKLYAEVEPGWKYGSDYGKLNVGRAMLDPDNYDEMFDEWDEGREHESGLEVFIALDCSGSMATKNAYVAASRALWIIKRALDDVGAKTTVVGFHVSTFGLYSRDDEAPKGMWPVFLANGADTRPNSSFQMARRLLNASDMPNKLFIIITDGVWSTASFSDYGDSFSSTDLIDLIPGHKMYVGVNGGGRYNTTYQSRFHTAVDLASPNALVRIVQDTVTMMLNNRR